jgi:hypothetical protein
MGIQFTRHHRALFYANLAGQESNAQGHWATWGPVGNRLDAVCVTRDPLIDSNPKGYQSWCQGGCYWDLDCWVQGGPNAPDINNAEFGSMVDNFFPGFWSPTNAGDWHSNAPGGSYKCDSTIYSGPQVILLEYDNTDEVDWNCGDGSSGWGTGVSVNCCSGVTPTFGGIHDSSYQNYKGPRFKIYGIGNNLPPSDNVAGFCGYPFSMTGPRWGSDLSQEILVTDMPAVADHPLWDTKTLFVGGIPPRRCVMVDPNMNSFPAQTQAQEDYWHKNFGNGMRGVLFEFMMFEGKLTAADKVQLGNILKAKYSFLQ